VHGIKEGLRWGEEYLDVHHMRIAPQSQSAAVFVNGIQYGGALIVKQGQGNQITLVNEVPIEEYIKSILAYKIETPLLLKRWQL